VHRGRDRVEKALVGVGREVDRDQRLRRDGRGDLDVEHHLAVGAVRRRRLVVRAVDEDRLHLRRRQAQPAEIGLQVGRPVAAAELDDADALPAAVEAGREVVQPGQRRRCERGLGCPRGEGARRLLALEMRVGLRPVVEAEHALDDALERDRQRDRAAAPAVAAAVVLDMLQRDAEGLGHRVGAAREHHAAPPGVGLDHREAVVLGEAAHRVDVLRIGAVGARIGLAAQVLALGRQRVLVHLADGEALGRGLGPQAQRDVDAFIGTHRAHFARARQRVAFAARQDETFGLLGHDRSPVDRRRKSVRLQDGLRQPGDDDGKQPRSGRPLRRRTPGRGRPRYDPAPPLQPSAFRLHDLRRHRTPDRPEPTLDRDRAARARCRR
jgi:hypothetical protein